MRPIHSKHCFVLFFSPIKSRVNEPLQVLFNDLTTSMRAGTFSYLLSTLSSASRIIYLFHKCLLSIYFMPGTKNPIKALSRRHLIFSLIGTWTVSLSGIFLYIFNQWAFVHQADSCPRQEAEHTVRKGWKLTKLVIREINRWGFLEWKCARR